MAQADHTIVAASSPPGRSLRGLVRLTGRGAHDVLAAMLADDLPVSLRGLTPARLRLGQLALPCLVSRFAAPASYTGQHMVELQLPGNPALLDRVVHQAIEHGAAPAEPGEFTFRAFLAGKLDLTQAEGVAATIAATSDAQLQAATMLRHGRLGQFAHDLVDTLADALALVEAGIDFTDQEDVVPITPGDLHARLTRIRAQLTDLLGHSRSWGTLDALPRVVLAGLPSTGKSTLFNALLGRTRAVVSQTAGTTRDVLSEPLGLIGDNQQTVEVLLMDIAGLDTPAGMLDQAAQTAARQAIEQADLVVAVSDIDQPWPVTASPLLHVRTKADQTATAVPHGFDLSVSAHTGQGLGDLKRLIAQRVGGQGVSVAGAMLALQPRHEASLKSAAMYLNEARDLLADQTQQAALDHMELIAGAMRATLDELAGLGGQMTPDDVIGRIFATFCIGK